MKTVTYLRRGRQRRMSGTVVGHGPNGTMKVKPERDGWFHVWIDKEEIEAAKEKPATKSICKHAYPLDQCATCSPVPPGSAYYTLFEHMSQEHGLTLLDSELADICHAVDRMRAEWGKNETSAATGSERNDHEKGN